MRSYTTLMANRRGFTSAAAEKVAIELSRQLGPLFGQYIEPTSFTFNEARGFWSHVHADVMKIKGAFSVGNLSYSIGSWDYNLTTLSRCKFHVIDQRGVAFVDSDFRIEKGELK